MGAVLWETVRNKFCFLSAVQKSWHSYTCDRKWLLLDQRGALYFPYNPTRFSANTHQPDQPAIPAKTGKTGRDLELLQIFN